MTPALICSIIFLIVGAVVSRFAKPRARRDIYLFAAIGAASMLFLGLAQMAQADDSPIVYVGAEFGVDWPHDGDTASPQCEPGGADGLTSDGRLFAGVEFTGPFYIEFDGWRHKSCALVDDAQVYDAYGIKFGARLEFEL